MTAKLAATVYVQDPDSHQTVELADGTSPEARLAALVTNPAAWVDGKLPHPPKTQEQASQGPTGGGQDNDSGDASADSADADQSDEAAPAAKKTAARKTAATGRSRGRDAADEGNSGD